jgi:hypothetical protein
VGKTEPAAERTADESLHELVNALASARMWITLIDHTPREQLAARLDETFDRLRRAVDDAGQSCDELRRFLASSRGK